MGGKRKRLSEEERAQNKDKRKQDEFKVYKHDALIAAHDLCYGERVKEEIREAKTIGEIARIMATARGR